MTCWNEEWKPVRYPLAIIEWKANKTRVSRYNVDWLRAFSRKRVHRAGWWVLATAVGWGVVSVVSLGQNFVVFPVSVAVAVGIGVGAITGLVLILLLRHPVPEA